MNLLEVQNLSKHFGGLMAVFQCNLCVEQGTIHALIGPNGAGKTTLIGTITGAVKASEGNIRFNGQDITHFPIHQRVHLGIARTYQITNVFKNYSVLDNVALAVQARSGTSFRFWKPVRSEKRLYEEAASMVEQVGLKGRENSLANQLSHGQQRQLEIAIALATHPKLLLLDEPMAGMGLDESARMVELIEQLNRQMTILLVEHDVDAVFRLAHRISVLVYGQVIASEVPEKIRSNPEVQKAYLGDGR
jgi:branched-chain amino acid transport system ATP-binding protein